MDRLSTLGSGAILGMVSACLYLTVLSGSPGALILAYLAQLPLFAAGLWFGVGATTAAGIVASVVVSAKGGLSTTATFAGLYAVPAGLLVRQALLARSRSDGRVEWYPSGLLTGWLTGLGLFVLGGTVLFFGGRDAIDALISEKLTPLMSLLADEAGPNGVELAKLLALIIPGAVAASWMTMTASNALLAQGVLARFGKAWRPSPDLAALTLPHWLSGLLVCAALMTALGGTARFIGVNVLVVLSVPFCLAGLAVLHTAARRLSRPQIPLALFYVAAGLFGWPLLAMAVLGVLDAPLGLRRRFAPSGSIGGNIDD